MLDPDKIVDTGGVRVSCDELSQRASRIEQGPSCDILIRWSNQECNCRGGPVAESISFDIPECFVCGSPLLPIQPQYYDKVIDAGIGVLSCSELELAALEGFIPGHFCSTVQRRAGEACGCFEAPPPPTPKPTWPPFTFLTPQPTTRPPTNPPPTRIPTRFPTPSPTRSPTLSPPTTATINQPIDDSLVGGQGTGESCSQVAGPCLIDGDCCDSYFCRSRVCVNPFTSATSKGVGKLSNGRGGQVSGIGDGWLKWCSIMKLMFLTYCFLRVELQVLGLASQSVVCQLGLCRRI